MSKQHLYGKTLQELKQICLAHSLPGFVCSQIADWMYKKHVTTIDEMTNLSIKARQALNQEFDIGLEAPLDEQISKDGTRKYLYRTEEGKYIESAYIPDGERATLCVSSQAGCRMRCAFCATGRQGLSHSLSTFDILNQIAALPLRDTLTNLVFMGMGEPLDNLENVLKALEIITSKWGYAWSPTRVTVSTAGVASKLDEFLSRTQVNLAVSLHNPFHEEREQIMPIEKAYRLEEVIAIIKKHDFSHQRRVSFEYIVMSGMNDSQAHIKKLCQLLDGVKCRINLIRFHKIPDSPYFSPDQQHMLWFRDTLTKKGIQTTIRASRGEDIQAACGLLSTEKQKSNS